MIREVAGERFLIFHGDNRAFLRTLPDDSVDSVVTDPPAGIAFMGSDWDDYSSGGREASEAWGASGNPYANKATPRYTKDGKSDAEARTNFVNAMIETFTEVKRVMKPGAYGLVWAIPKTAHWMAWALEDTGFQVVEIITHLYGQGFPKSLNVAKAIDATLLNGGSNTRRLRQTEQENGGEEFTRTQRNNGLMGEDVTVTRKLWKPVTPEAQQWNGWGTALKPAAEFWVLIRKPTDLTYAKNVLTHGVGALNIDGTRVGDSKPTVAPSTKVGKTSISLEGAADGSLRQPHVGTAHDPTKGRWPANLVLSHDARCVQVGEEQVERRLIDATAATTPSMFGAMGGSKSVGTSSATVPVYACVPHCPIRMLDDSVGERKSGARKAGTKRKKSLGDGGYSGDMPDQPFTADAPASSGMPSRFFYTSKVPPKQRYEGLPEGVQCHHPTEKNVELIRYFARLVTPPGGTVLDPFGGSGTTGMAALREGFSFLAAEQDDKFFKIIRWRLDAEEGRAANVPVFTQGSLF